jgi:hypothetical protein
LYRKRGERSLTVEERLEALPFTPDFFVITDFREFDGNHADLKDFLLRRCALVADTSEYLIYNSCGAPLSHAQAALQPAAPPVAR